MKGSKKKGISFLGVWLPRSGHSKGRGHIQECVVCGQQKWDLMGLKLRERTQIWVCDEGGWIRKELKKGWIWSKSIVKNPKGRNEKKKGLRTEPFTLMLCGESCWRSSFQHVFMQKSMQQTAVTRDTLDTCKFWNHIHLCEKCNALEI